MSRPIKLNPETETPGRAAAAIKPSRRAGNVILIGLSGSGKTTVARLLARRMGWRAVDTDREIERRTGSTIEQIFKDQGEKAFRAIESEVLRATCAKNHQVISTGGGAVVDEANRSTMLAGNVIVFLDSSPETLADRLASSNRGKPRPLLLGQDLLTRLSELQRQRAPYYRCAHHVVSTDGRTPQQVADAVAELIRARR